MKRWQLAWVLVLGLAVGSCGGGSALSVPEPRPGSEALAQDVDRILDLADVEDILAARARAFVRQVAIMMGDPSDSELERLVEAVFATFDYGTLRSEVAAYMVEEGTPELAGAALVWLEGGATSAVRRIGEEYQPAQTLEEYAAEMTDEPPAEARVHLISAWAEARGEGSFFVLLQEALREAAYRVHRAFRSDGPRFQPLSGEELEIAEVNSHGASVIRLLHGYAPAPDQLIRRATAEHESEAGRWLRDTYALAVATAIRSAGERAAAMVSSGGDR